MDGNEKNLPAPRVGVGDNRTLKRGGIVAKTPKGVAMRAVERVSVVTPSVRKSNQFLSAKKKINAKKAKADSTLKTMMHRMNKGKQPDESGDETTDSEALDEYLEQWIDRDLNNEDTDPEYMAYENTENGQDGQEVEKVQDYRVSNDFRIWQGLY